ncbi:glutamyl-queuosine tRNA(Asp) synthetase, partial [Vibrio parahaemolyticus EKP-028]
TLSQLYCMP